MVATSKAQIMYECPDCHTEFPGKECPECGLSKGKIRLAKDGIAQDIHKPEVLFGDVNNLTPTKSILNKDDSEFLRQRAEYQKAETLDNLRESMLTKSEIKNTELKKDLLKMKLGLEQYDPVPNDPNTQGWTNSYPPPQTTTPPDQAQQLQGMFGQQSPQSLFMSKFMTMKPEQRKALLEEVADADPSAIQALSTMMTPQQQSPYPPMMQPGMMNPYMMPGMMQQPPQEQPQSDPMESAINMMATMFEMFRQNQPTPDTGLKEALHEFKSELGKINDRVSNISNVKHDSDDHDLRNELNGIKQMVQASSTQPGVMDNIRDLKDLIKELDSAGLTNNTAPGNSIDDTIKLKEAAHKIEIENREFGLKENQLKTNDNVDSFKKQFATAIFQKELQKNIKPKEEPPSIYHGLQKQQPFVPRPSDAPKVVVSEHVADSGVVKETREPVQKE